MVCGRSSGVERNLAKVEVVSSNLIARSIYLINDNRLANSALSQPCVEISSVTLVSQCLRFRTAMIR